VSSDSQIQTEFLSLKIMMPHKIPNSVTALVVRLVNTGPAVSIKMKYNVYATAFISPRATRDHSSAPQGHENGTKLSSAISTGAVANEAVLNIPQVRSNKLFPLGKNIAKRILNTA
jgi:hypothetical protein